MSDRAGSGLTSDRMRIQSSTPRVRDKARFIQTFAVTARMELDIKIHVMILITGLRLSGVTTSRAS
jgi:hypothetical protein